MKNLFIILTLLTFNTLAQNAKIIDSPSGTVISNNAGNDVPASTSILDVRSTNKGVLIPRMTTTNRDAIGSPTAGLMLYNSSTNHFNYWNGSTWTDFNSAALTLPFVGSGAFGFSGQAGLMKIENTGSGNGLYVKAGLGQQVTTPTYAGYFESSQNGIFATSGVGNLALQTAGGLQLRTIGEAANKILTSTDQFGNAVWQSTASLTGLSLTGNGADLDRTLTTDGSGVATWAGPVGFAVARSADFSINSGAETIIPFTITLYDQGDNYITNRFTAPHDGLYHFDASITWNTTFSATSVILQIRHNDTIGDAKRLSTNVIGITSGNPRLSVSATFYMLGSEWVELRASQNSGSAKSVESSASTYFSGYLVR